MLSSAHILAMDAKNLLDVIDSIRMNFPNVDMMITSRPSGHTPSPSPARTRSSVSASSGSASASSSAASSLEKHRDTGLSPLHSSRGSPLVHPRPSPSIT